MSVETLILNKVYFLLINYNFRWFVWRKRHHTIISWYYAQVSLQNYFFRRKISENSDSAKKSRSQAMKNKTLRPSMLQSPGFHRIEEVDEERNFESIESPAGIQKLNREVKSFNINVDTTKDVKNNQSSFHREIKDGYMDVDQSEGSLDEDQSEKKEAKSSLRISKKSK